MADDGDEMAMRSDLRKLRIRMAKTVDVKIDVASEVATIPA